MNDAPIPFIQFSSNEPFSLDLEQALAGKGQNSTIFFGFPDGDTPPGLLLPGQGKTLTFQVVPRGIGEVVNGSENVSYVAPAPVR